MKRFLLAVAVVALVALPIVSHAQDFAESRLPEILAGMINLDIPDPVMKMNRLAKTAPDECYNGIGQPYPELNPDGTCPEGIPKRNQSYVWGLTQSGGKLYFGTASNVLCQVLQSLSAISGGGSVQFEGETFVCEGNQAQSGTGDFRPAKIYSYEIKTRTLTDVTPPDIAKVSGIRSAGALGRIVFLAGPSGLTGQSAITMYAYDSATNEFLGSHTFEEYTDIRKWIVFRDGLYTAVQNVSSVGGGSVLRWRGTRANLWNFEVVGSLPNAGANISLYGTNRLAVSTWPYNLSATNPGAGIYISPPAHKNGLYSGDAANWKEVFLYRGYEPDMAIKKAYFGGDLAYYRGWLYWGSMHVPGYSAVVHKLVYGDNAAANTADLLVGTWRSTSLWRGRYLETDHPEVELLYGETELAKYDWDPVTQTGTKTFNMVPTGWIPKFGKSGFGNIFNGYTWVMAVANGSLFIGTLDISYLLKEVEAAAAASEDAQAVSDLLLQLPLSPDALAQIVGFGADIWRIDSPNQPAHLESRDGEKNQVNYGFRTMQVSTDGKSIYVGTANPFNIDRRGGWELLRLTPQE